MRALRLPPITRILNEEEGLYQEMEPKHGIVRSQVLERFAFRLKDLESLPPFESIMRIPIYQPFLLRGLRESLVREEQERTEKVRLQALLKAHGIDPHVTE